MQKGLIAPTNRTNILVQTGTPSLVLCVKKCKWTWSFEQCRRHSSLLNEEPADGRMARPNRAALQVIDQRSQRPFARSAPTSCPAISLKRT
jgi:hypothetical protein